RTLVELLIDRVLVDNGDVEIRYVIPTTPHGETTRFYQLRKDYFEVPLVLWLGASTLQLIRVVLPKFQTPLTDGFMADVDAAFEQQLLYIAVAQGKAVVEPDPMADDLISRVRQQGQQLDNAVTELLSSDARNETACAISSVRPSRPSGIAAA